MPLVGAAACAHIPQLLVRPRTEDRDLVMAEAGFFMAQFRLRMETGESAFEYF
ncbi:MAG: hypothetical protein XU13_C0017G0005 [Candidatus Rokubacteria bacterium CSP1-6]|nr:MAG: hypothetical protein XU13_C0017G0005 [Candidatus Rokubacteria bacterium CSP1-6]